MALLKPSPALPPNENYARFRAAFDAIDAVMARVDAVDEGLASEIVAANAHIQDSVDRIERVIAQAQATAETELLAAIVQGRSPGVCPTAFSAVSVGAIADTPALDPAGCVSGALGPAYQIVGAGLVAPRAVIAVDPDAIWILRARYWRVADVLDPNNNAVDIGVQWLDVAGRDLGTTLVRRERNLLRQDGPRILVARVPSLVGKAPVIVAPKGAVACRPYLRSYGADGMTAVGELGASEATFAGVYAPDVSALAARLGTVEGQITTGFALQTRALLLAVFAALPADRSQVAIGEPYRAGEMIAFRVD